MWFLKNLPDQSQSKFRFFCCAVIKVHNLRPFLNRRQLSHFWKAVLRCHLETKKLQLLILVVLSQRLRDATAIGKFSFICPVHRL